MSENPIVHSHELTIRFDEHEDGLIDWYAVPDDPIRRTHALSPFELAERGAPLSAMGIRALWKLCMDGTIYSALELATEVRREVIRRHRADNTMAEPIELPEGATIN